MGLRKLGYATLQTVYDAPDSNGTLLDMVTSEKLIRYLSTKSFPLTDRVEMGAQAKARLEIMQVSAEIRSNVQADPYPAKAIPLTPEGHLGLSRTDLTRPLAHELVVTTRPVRRCQKNTRTTYERIPR